MMYWFYVLLVVATVFVAVLFIPSIIKYRKRKDQGSRRIPEAAIIEEEPEIIPREGSSFDSTSFFERSRMTVAKSAEDIRSFESVQVWLDELGKKTFNKVMVDSWLSYLQRFCEFTGMKPDQLVDLRIKEMAGIDRKKRGHAKRLLNRFYNEYKKRSQAGACVAFTAVKSFYRSNDAAVNVKTPEVAVVREHTLVPTQEQIRKMADLCSLRDQTLIVFMAETGMRVSEVLGLKQRHLGAEFEAGGDICAVYPPRKRGRKGGPRVTFICPDAVGLLKKFFEVRQGEGEAITDESYLFVSTRGIRAQLTRTGAYKIILKAGVRSGLITKKRGLKAFHSHCFRKRVQTILEGSGIPLNWVDYLLGHKPRGAQASAYSLPSDEQLKEAYRKAVPKLQIYGISGVEAELIERIAAQKAEELFKRTLKNRALAHAT